eukprot:TRINITY_DN7207_c0_g1_i1.p1 TRINITY_DN7207_c0_g1~~TRINITY_DN7207_c0_g1_i1.p1  ORF type:complete len:310 (+),score=77.38 TRINITY_DN7207_c0_g1_i1:382-1311(+)
MFKSKSLLSFQFTTKKKFFHQSTKFHHSHQIINVYHYTNLSNLPALKRDLEYSWGESLGIKGRIYLHNEGINAQLSVPIENVEKFKQVLKSYPIFENANVYDGDIVNVNIEELNQKTSTTCSVDVEQEEYIDEFGKKKKKRKIRTSSMDPRPPEKIPPFLKLNIRLRPLVSDGFGVSDLDMSVTGNSIPPKEWHEVMSKKKDSESKDKEEVTVLDCRNFYESEIGKFDVAERLPIDKHLDSFDYIEKTLQGKEDSKIYMYCTGGIRCEKIAAYLIQKKGFKNVNRLEGGINNYIKYVKESSLPSRFIGN